MRPLLVLDVDGTLNPWPDGAGKLPSEYVAHRFRLSRWRRRTLRV
jgi:hypothetical protein